MDGRIKQVRKARKLTQAAFGERIGLKANTITSYEKGLRMPSEAAIMAMCREYRVNRKWLETGEGEMEAPSRSQALDRIAQTYSQSRTFRAILDVYAQMNEEERAVIEKYIDLLSDAVSQGKDPASALPTREDLARNAAETSSAWDEGSQIS